MKLVAVVVIVVLCAITSAQAQTFIPSAQLSAPHGFASQLFENGDGTWTVARYIGDSLKAEAVVLSDRWKCTPISNSVIQEPSMNAAAMLLSPTDAWVGLIDKVRYTSDNITWYEIATAGNGREAEIMALTRTDDGGVVGSVNSYVVRRVDTSSGGLLSKWTEHMKRSVVLFNNSERVVLFEEDSYNMFTNVEQISHDEFVTASGNGFHFLKRNGTDIFATLVTDAQMPHRGIASCMHRTSERVDYSFHGIVDPARGPRGPSMVVYDENTQRFQWVELRDIAPIRHVTSRGRLVIGSAEGGIAIIKGTSVSFLPLSDGIRPWVDVISTSFVNGDTLIANTQYGLFVIPMSVIAATSVEAPSPGRTLTSSSSHLIDIVDGTQEVVWSVFDNAGRVVLAGTMGVGQRDLRLPLEGVSSGVYHLRLTAGGRVLQSHSVLLTQ